MKIVSNTQIQEYALRRWENQTHQYTQGGSLNAAELAARIRYTAADLLAIARGHAEVGNVEIAAKMTEAAGDLKGRADALQREAELAGAKPARSTVPVRVCFACDARRLRVSGIGGSRIREERHVARR